MQTDMSNFCVCSLGGVWRETSILGERLLDNLLSIHRKDLQMSHLVNSVGMRRHDRGGPQDPKRRKGGTLERMGLAAGGREEVRLEAGPGQRGQLRAC